MSKRSKIIYGATLLTCSIFFVMGVAIKRPSGGGAKNRQGLFPAPAFTLSNTAGDRQNTKGLIGRKYGLLFFRAECSFCIEELRKIRWFVMQKKEFELFLVSLSDAATTERVSSDLGLNVVWYGNPENFESSFKIKGVPALYLIDENGNIVYSQIGVRDERYQRLVFERFVKNESLSEEILRKLLGP